MTLRNRSWASYLFLASIVLGMLWFGAQAIIALQEVDPTKLRINRAPLGAAMIIVVDLILLALYFKAGELVGLVRVLAAVIAVVQILQSVVVGLLANYAEGVPFPELNHVVTWFLAAGNLLYAFVGERVQR